MTYIKMIVNQKNIMAFKCFHEYMGSPFAPPKTGSRGLIGNQSWREPFPDRNAQKIQHISTCSYDQGLEEFG